MVVITDLVPELLRAIIKQITGPGLAEANVAVFNIMRGNKLWS